MAVHVRVDQYFVENAQWEAARQRYSDFLGSLVDQKTVLLELGVGFNTPGIIRFPFEKIAQSLGSATLIRMNRDDVGCLLNVKNKLLLKGDITSLDFKTGVNALR